MANAQEHFKVSIFVHSNTNPLENVTIQISNHQKINSDSIGKAEIQLKSGNYLLIISAIGRKTVHKNIKVYQNLNLDIDLEEESTSLNEVAVSSERYQRNLANTQMGIERLSINTIKNIPAIFGEKDIIKAIQLLPGIKSAGEGSAGIFVRGGSSDENLILMDEVPVYNASHLLGFFSTFNPDAVEDISIYKTGMPANYGGRLSSVLDVKMRQGDLENLKVSGGIGLISSKLTLEGPLKKNKSSFLISARRTYVDQLLRLSSDTAINRNTLYFYDLNANLNFQLNPKNKLIFNGYMGSDKFGLNKAFDISWGNINTSAQWKHLFSNQLSSTTLLALSNYQNQIDINTEVNNIKIYSSLKDWNFSQLFFWNPNENHQLKFGLNSIYHKVMPGKLNNTGASSFNPFQFQERSSFENNLFFNDEWKITKRFNLNYGLRLNIFSILGGSTYQVLDEAGNTLSSRAYNKGEFVHTYLNPEPRLALSYLLDENSSLKASYVRNSQNMHLISNSTSDRPTDKWLPSSLMVKPELSDQIAIGYYLNLFQNQYEINIESYYKTMNRLLDYRDGSEIFDADNIEKQLLYGIGKAYGLEILLKKREGKFHGWLSYTLARSQKKIDGINGGNWYNARQDRTHELSFVGNYKLNDKWSLSATWVYYTGNAVTFPEGKYIINGQPYFYYTERNAYRMPNYHRLDLGATKQLRKRKHFSSELAFGLYNAYARKNAYSITFRKAKSDPNQTEIVQTTLFKLLPSISYNFKF